LFYRYRNTLS